MAVSFLDFEQPIAELEAKIEELGHVTSDSEVNIEEEIARLRAKSRALTRSIFANLTPWQITQLARHPQRPYTLDYIASIFTDFHELHGDRMYADDMAIVGGLARLEGDPVMVIGHQKGRDTKERVRRNYGMPKPEGYRKALRLMKLAERFGLPLITLIDTPGAYPGVGSEERGQSEAIARNLFEMASLRVPIISVVIGEGGSGGALAIGVCDRLLMLQFSTYSVISPEGCASILWKSADKKEVAAEALNLTAERLGALGLVDEVLAEPLGGAHRDAERDEQHCCATALNAPSAGALEPAERAAARAAPGPHRRLRCLQREPCLKRRAGGFALARLAAPTSSRRRAPERFTSRWLGSRLRALDRPAARSPLLPRLLGRSGFERLADGAGGLRSARRLRAAGAARRSRSARRFRSLGAAARSSRRVGLRVAVRGAAAAHRARVAASRSRRSRARQRYARAHAVDWRRRSCC